MSYRYDPAAAQAVFAERFTFLAGFLRNVERFATRPALRDPAADRTWTYAELGADVDRLAAGLAAHGVGPRDVVVFQLHNGPPFALAYLAAQRLGAVACPINFRFSAGETAHVLDDSRPAAYLHEASLSAMATEAVARSGHRPALVAATGAPFEELLGTGEGVGHNPVAGAWDEATRLYTSGTTGLPKGVSLPGAAEVLTAHDVIMHFPLDPGDRTLNMTPWFHRGGISPGGPNAVFYVGAAAVVLPAFDADVCLDLVADEGLTYLVGAPTNLAMLAEAQAAKPRDLSTLRGVVTMGAPLDRAACLRYQELLTPRIFNGYGTTEAFWNTFLRPADLPEHAGSAGRACTDDDVAVVSTDGPVPKDGATVGEVIMRSSKSGYGYVNSPEADEKFRDGWLHSGDLGTWDAEGYVTIVGRKDDMIISGGENVHPVQVEEVLAEHPGVLDAIVVGLPDERWGQLVVAFVQARGAGPTAAELDRHCREHPMLSDYKRPRAYRFVADLPRTATGKKMHYRIRDELADPAVASDLERL